VPAGGALFAEIAGGVHVLPSVAVAAGRLR